MSMNPEKALEETGLNLAADTPGPGILTVTLSSGETLSSAKVLSADQTSELFSLCEPEVRKRWLIYAIVEYGGVQAYSEATATVWLKRRGGQRHVVLWPGDGHWTGRSSSFKFDVSAASELAVYLFERKLDPSTGDQRVTSLGWIKLHPFLEPWVPGYQSVDVQGGTGSVKLEVSYLEKKVLPLEDRDVWTVRREVRFGDLVRVEKCDTYRVFAMKTINAPGAVPRPEEVRWIEHPFIAPLEFIFESPEGLRLLSPVASGGYLFSYLQGEHRFTVDRAKACAAELTCALEYLHTRLIIPVYPKPENIALDATGHISLCNPGLFGPEEKDGHPIVLREADIAAPELLLGQGASEAVDWWSLGVLLHEMLTGLPPFYNEDVQEQRRQITNQALPLPKGLPTAARDILIKLLDKDPTRRLGANGAAEVKTHPFFYGVNWLELTQRRREAIFDPSEAETVFRLEPDELRDSRYCHETGLRRVLEEGVVETQVQWSPFGNKFWYLVDGKDEEDALEQNSSSLDDDEWDMVWERASRTFYFNNRSTSENRPIRSDAVTSPDCDSTAESSRPSRIQKKGALKAALEARYSNRTISQILRYDVDLDDAIFERHIWSEYGHFGREWSGSDWLTPLEWVTDNGNATLVVSFLEHGVDANFSTHPRKGPALVRAVKRRNQKLIDMLLSKSNRVTSTRALCHAVEQQDVAIVTTLLANGALPDFLESDRPRPVIPSPFAPCAWPARNRGESLKAQDFTPPLARAARLGNARLVRLLLEHGADANAAYHVLDVPDPRRPWEKPAAPIHFACGRAAQLAQELGHSEVVRLLLDGGADVGLPAPVWPVPGHTCPLVPRSVYVRVTAGLKAAAAR